MNNRELYLKSLSKFMLVNMLMEKNGEKVKYLYARSKAEIISMLLEAEAKETVTPVVVVTEPPAIVPIAEKKPSAGATGATGNMASPLAPSFCNAVASLGSPAPQHIPSLVKSCLKQEKVSVAQQVTFA